MSEQLRSRFLDEIGKKNIQQEECNYWQASNFVSYFNIWLNPALAKTSSQNQFSEKNIPEKVNSQKDKYPASKTQAAGSVKYRLCASLSCVAPAKREALALAQAQVRVLTQKQNLIGAKTK